MLAEPGFPFPASFFDSFFNPRRIAIVGASEQGMYPAGILQNLLIHGYPGQLYPVNPRRDTVFGLPCYPDVTQTPQPADLAILTVSRRAVLPVLRQCLQAAIPAALIISAGFAEADEEGQRLQGEMKALLAGGQLRIIGPNCAGLANIPGRVIATRLPAPLLAPPRAGPISFVSQSGALMMAFYGLFADRHIGLDRLLSLGNQVDVTLAESLAYLLDEAQTAVVGAFVEGIGDDRADGRAFVAALRHALLVGKPLVLIKSGRTAAGQQAAASHTAALSGSDRVFAAVCRQFGAIQVEDVDELLDTLQVLSAFGRRLNTPGRLVLVTQSGGLGSLAADLSQMAGLELPPLSETVRAALRALPFLLDFDQLGNPADVRGAAVIGENTAATLAPFLADADSDVVVLLLAKSSVREQDAQTAEAIVAVARQYEKPLLVVWVGQRQPIGETAWWPGETILLEGGVPVFSQPGNCIRALSRAVGYWRFRRGWLVDVEDNRVAER